ncbi:hypothetical protein BH10PLA1_BH10PLA1_18860 [soil metagenome]
MADKKPTPSQETLHPGSSAQDAAKVGGKGDFGVRESDVAERTYTSMNTKQSDRGNAQSRSGSDGTRTSGAGGNNSGVGSSSGGDLDTDLIFGGGVAASGSVNEPAGPDDTDGGSSAFASGAPAKGDNQRGPVKPVTGSTVQPLDDRSARGQGADASANSDADSDASAGEISTSEASGADN